MARRRKPGDSSLELLLDTICNTFGGVLFLAMLVSLMLTQTSRKTTEAAADPRPAVSAADFVRLDSRLRDATAAVEALSDQATQARRTAGILTVPNAAELIQEMEHSERQAAELETRRGRLLTALASDQSATARSLAARATAERDRVTLADQAARARARLADAVEDRRVLLESSIRITEALQRHNTVTTTGRAPLMRSTNKMCCGLMVQYGRAYLMKTLQAGIPVVNENDFTLLPGSESNVAMAKPHAGVDLTDAKGFEDGLRRRMAAFPAADWYVCLVVHPDSFDQYLGVKNWLVQHGYEYELLPTSGNVSDHGSGRNVQVQ